MHFNIADCLVERSGQNLQERAFASPIAADDSYHLSPLHLEGNVLQGPDLRMPRFSRDNLPKQVGRTSINLVQLREMSRTYGDTRWQAHSTFPKKGFSF